MGKRVNNLFFLESVYNIHIFLFNHIGLNKQRELLLFLFKENVRFRKMAQQIKVLSENLKIWVHSQNTRDKRKLISTSCPLTSTFISQNMSACTHVPTHNQQIKHNKKKIYLSTNIYSSCKKNQTQFVWLYVYSEYKLPFPMYFIEMCDNVSTRSNVHKEKLYMPFTGRVDAKI